ncbi:MAG: hypothetical protein LBN04_05780 [Oscillospiraceae bacterium]|jgi:hypothetical protein|nr:hypothetical protein [Oscillospiraceae bacterium]
MKKTVWMILVVIALCALGGAALADTHTVPEIGLTFETPEGWRFAHGSRAAILGSHQLQETMDAMGIDGICRGFGNAYDGSIPLVSWNFIAHEQPAWWINSYRGLSDQLLREMNNDAFASAPTILHGKAAKWVLWKESADHVMVLAAYTIEGGQGIYFFATIPPDAPDAEQQVLDMLKSAAFDGPMPAPAPAPALRDAAAWEDAFASLEKSIALPDLPALPVDAAVAEMFAGYPLTILRLYANESLFLALLGDADGTIREVFIGHVLAEIAQSETLLAEAFDAFSTTAAMAMAITAEQTGQLALEANKNLTLEAMDKTIFDENTPYSLFYDWNGLDLEVGFDAESVMVYADLFL